MTMVVERDEITLQKAKVNGLVQARDAISHEIAIEQTKLERLIQEQRDLKRMELCEE